MGMFATKIYRILTEGFTTEARILLLGLDAAGKTTILYSLIYVVDSADPERIDEAKNVLHRMMTDRDMIGVPIVVFANKQDIQDAMDPAHIMTKLDVKSLQSQWHVQGTSAITGEGIYEGLDVLSKMVKEFKKNRAGRF
ncbi:PREDICTED: ADP-ribosylation factor-like [Priapulus caudatus]|uniref:ADP-ribosylation factor-like n=1 Tax=Priapulus caudatus TaxID=37621 RepID=A0ABM1EVG8_PRICU|nr:PREDICTED: ADP-ribosylation factor-like [Priapulus caudatus]